MATYKELRGTQIEAVATDPSNPVEGQVWYNTDSNVLKGQAATAADAWSTGGALNTARMYLQGAGTQTAGIAFGGQDPGVGRYDNTELYNGSNWTEVNDLGTARGGIASASAGPQTASLAIGGESPTASLALTESWNGTNWTEVTDIGTARHLLKGAGTYTAAIVFGGSPQRDQTETWNGSNWTEVNDLNLGRAHHGGFGATNTAAIAFGGESSYPPYDNETELWNGTNWTEVNTLSSEKAYLGGLGEYTSGLCIGGILGPGTKVGNVEEWNGTNWTETTDLSTTRFAMGAGGNTTAGLAFGGGTPSASTATEEWNAAGTSVTRTFTDS